MDGDKQGNNNYNFCMGVQQENTERLIQPLQKPPHPLHQ